MQNQFKKPFPMSRISYPTSDAELETWVEQTIQREIVRGRMLQDRKSIASERSNNVNILIKSPKLANGGNFHRRTISKWNKRGRSKSPLAKNARMSSSASRDDSCRSYQSPRMGRPACSMRISELAAPTKRQCMASWRANANILPEAMINRLKQRVTDQEPIVKVSDAVNCLAHNRRSSDTRNGVIITPSKRASRKINKEAMRNKIQAEYKVLSDAFGVKIAELLMKPIVINLNSRLQNISNIISEEIYNIIKDTTFKMDKAINKRMLREVSEKVTIWIAEILEDSSEKLLEEELRDLEEQEGPVLDLLDDFVDSILHKCIKTPSDILTPEFLSITSEDVEKDDQQETDRQTADEEAIRDDVITMDEKTNEDTIENDIMKQLLTVIDSVTQEDYIESPNKTSDVRSMSNEEKYGEPDIQSEGYINPESEIQSQFDIKPELNTKVEPDIDVLYSNDTPLAMPEDDNDDEHNENISGSPELSSTQLPSNEIPEAPMMEPDDGKLEDNTSLAPEDNNVTDRNEEPSSNVSDAVEVIAEELSEGKNKTVQFSKENLDSINDILKDQNNPLNRKNLHLEDEQLLENIAYFDRPHIDFAPPNEELLSDADESWPEMKPLTKPSASVTRSITSMGKLLEADEMFSTALDDATEYLLKTTDSKRHNEGDNDDNNRQGTVSPYVAEEIGDLQSSKESLHVNEKGDQPDGPLVESEIYNPSESLLEPTQEVQEVTSIQKVESVILICDEDEQDTGLYDHIICETDKSTFYQSQTPEHLQKDTTNDDVNERQNTEELISQKFDYRVHLKDAPAWIRRGQGEPNVGHCTCMSLNYSGYTRTDNMQDRVREYQKWCQDLDFILMNLYKWNKWIKYISKYITDLKRKAGKINRGRQRSPARTEEDVTWRQLHKRATGVEVRRQDQTVKFKIPSAPLKYCLKCGRRKPNPSKKRPHQSNLRNNAESKCKRHHKREHQAYLSKN
ncbi:uncharacterized protein LOC134789770 isoform X2 [Cydia splendana]|uniref:uncharacterized protein LOC134789770 isoform X2 n=1 Tax=Cydia splendana TaxID=1100963 RepID=UPI0028F48D51